MLILPFPDKRLISDEIEEIKQVGEIEEIGEVESAGGSGLGIVELAGRFHPEAIHFPIAWLVLLLLVENVALFTGMASGFSQMALFRTCGCLHAACLDRQPLWRQNGVPRKFSTVLIQGN